MQPRLLFASSASRRVFGAGLAFAAACGLVLAGGNLAYADGAAPAAATPTAPALDGSAAGGAVIVILKDQHANLNLRTQAAARTAAAAASQAPVVAAVRSYGGTDVRQLVAPDAVAAHLSAAAVSALRSNPAVAEIVPDQQIQMQPSGAGPSMPARAAPARPAKPGKATNCPFNPAGTSRPLEEPEADAAIHASNGNPNAPDEANSIADGQGVIVANQGINELAGNPNFTRPDGSHVVIDAPDYTVDNGNDETYGDASSIAAQGTVTYQYSQSLPFSSVPPGCTFYIEGDAPGASLVDLTGIDTPVLSTSQVLAGIDNAVDTVHADVISESFGGGAALTMGNDAAVAAGVTVVQSGGDSGNLGTFGGGNSVGGAVLMAGATDNFRLVAMNDGYSSYVSNQIAALSSGGTAAPGNVEDLVAPGWYGGEAACSTTPTAIANGCPPNYPVEAMRGTSESAPLIAGAAADVIQAYRDTHAGASPTPEMVKDILTSTATDLGDPADQQGDGLLNIYRAVRAAQQMPGSTDPQGPGDAPSLVTSPHQLDVTGEGGTVSHQSVSVYNTSGTATRVTGSYRVLGPEHQIGRVTTEHISAPAAGTPLPPQGATAAPPVTFTVPRGLNLLDADMIWPDPTNSNILQVQLFNPSGALVQESYDDPGGGHEPNVSTTDVPDVQHVIVSDPAPGTWTAKFLWSGLDVDPAQGPSTPGTYTGPMSFKVSGQDYTYQPAFAPVTIAGHASATIPLDVAMPRQPGDYPESVQLSASNGAAVSLPVARRTLIPSSGGRFSTVITGNVGRGIGQSSTFEVNVPAGRPDLDVNLATADASPDNGYTFSLVSPSGTVAATATTPVTINGHPAAVADLDVADPAAGTWQISIRLNVTTSGKEFTQTVYGNLSD